MEEDALGLCTRLPINTTPPQSTVRTGPLSYRTSDQRLVVGGIDALGYSDYGALFTICWEIEIDIWQRFSVPAQGQAEQYDSDSPQKQSWIATVSARRRGHTWRRRRSQRGAYQRDQRRRLPLWDLPGQTVRTTLWKSALRGHSADVPDRGGCTLFVKYTYFMKRIVQVSSCLLHEGSSCFKGTCIWLLWLCYLYILYDY